MGVEHRGGTEGPGRVKRLQETEGKISSGQRYCCLCPTNRGFWCCSESTCKYVIKPEPTLWFDTHLQYHTTVFEYSYSGDTWCYTVN